jgi:hypothetical protein
MNFAPRSGLVLAVLAIGLSAIPTSAQQPPPPDQPIAATAEQSNVYEKVIAPLVKQARESLPAAKAKYLAGLKPREAFYVTIRLYGDQIVRVGL